MSDTFCPLPWNHLATHPDGCVSLCCKADLTNLTGFSQTVYPNEFRFQWRLGRQPFQVIHNAETFANARLSMLAGEEPPGCRGCYEVERMGGRSKRLIERQNFPDLTQDRAASLTDHRGFVVPDYEFIELRLGNVCNLRCATCNPVSSNQWEDDYEALSRKFEWVDRKMTSSVIKLVDKTRLQKVFVAKEEHWSTNPDFWASLYRSSPNCRKIYINGGEPTLNREHIEFLSWFVRDGRAQGITLIYSTNVTNVPKELMTDVWAQFGRVEINASVDCVEERNTHIRYPASWEKIIRTLVQLKNLPNIDLTIIQTLSAYNLLYLAEFHRWTQSTGIRWWVNHVDQPDYLSPYVIPPADRQAALKKYQDTLPPYILREITARYDNDKTADAERFIAFNDELDRLRATDWRATFPRLRETIE
jgi:hypothetical protein